MRTKTYYFDVLDIDKQHTYVRQKAINEIQARTLVAQLYPEHTEITRVARPPESMMQYVQDGYA